nr:hypothetical protein Itr_chr04CG17440 [Ipomoea trifida]
MPSATSNTAARNGSHQRGMRARHPLPPRLPKLAHALVARPSSLPDVVDHEVRRGRKIEAEAPPCRRGNLLPFVAGRDRKWNNDRSPPSP